MFFRVEGGKQQPPFNCSIIPWPEKHILPSGQEPIQPEFGNDFLHRQVNVQCVFMISSYVPFGLWRILEVSQNATPKSFILRGVSVLKHPFWKTSISQKPHSLSAAPAKRPPHLRGCACLWTDAVAMMAMRLGRGLRRPIVCVYIYICNI